MTGDEKEYKNKVNEAEKRRIKNNRYGVERIDQLSPFLKWIVIKNEKYCIGSTFN